MEREAGSRREAPGRRLKRAGLLSLAAILPAPPNIFSALRPLLSARLPPLRLARGLGVWSGVTASVWRMSQPCFLAVETMERRQAKVLAPPSAERAGDFHFDLGHPDVLFGQVVGERDVEVDEEAQHVVLEGLEPGEQVETGPVLETAARSRVSRELGRGAWKAKPSRTAAQIGPRRPGPGLERALSPPLGAPC